MSEIEGVIGKCWTEEFPLGLLTFEALERMLSMCAGAVFLMVTADERGRPNENDMIEVGLVAGRMGRTRVALCTNDDIRLPSDLAAITRIDSILTPPNADNLMGKETSVGARTISQAAIERLQTWAKVLPAVLQSTPSTQVLHGYSGHWRAVLNFEKWRNRAVGNNVAGLSADLMLHVPADGQGGSGILFGKLTLSWQASERAGL